MQQTVFALTRRDRALDIVKEAGAVTTSNNPIVRGIIDSGIGFVSLGTVRPQGKIQEQIIRIDTEAPERAVQILQGLPGVVKVAPRFDALTRN